MWEVLWKCALTGVVVGTVVGLVEKHGSDRSKALAGKVGDSIDDTLESLFPPKQVWYGRQVDAPTPVYSTHPSMEGTGTTYSDTKH